MGNLLQHRVLIAHRRNPIVAAAADIDGHPQARELVVGIMVLARLNLPTCAHLAAWLARAHPEARQRLIHQRLELCWIGGLPGGIAPRVAEFHHPASPFLQRQTGKLVEGVRCPTGAATARTGQDEACYTLRIAERELLGYHATERNPHHQAAIPAHCLQQAIRISSVIRHGVGHIRLFALAETALVVGENLEVTGQWKVEGIRRAPQVATRTADEEQAWTSTANLIIHPDAADGNEWHGNLPS